MVVEWLLVMVAVFCVGGYLTVVPLATFSAERIVPIFIESLLKSLMLAIKFDDSNY